MTLHDSALRQSNFLVMVFQYDNKQSEEYMHTTILFYITEKSGYLLIGAKCEASTNVQELLSMTNIHSTMITLRKKK